MGFWHISGDDFGYKFRDCSIQCWGTRMMCRNFLKIMFEDLVHRYVEDYLEDVLNMMFRITIRMSVWMI